MKTKLKGIFPLIIVLLAFSSLVGEKMGEVAVVVPIIKLHTLPSGEADTKGFATKGQRLMIDGESGSWYRIRFSDASNAWVTKEAVNVLKPYDPEIDQSVSAAPKTPAIAERSAAVKSTPASGANNSPAERVVAPAPQQAINKMANQGATPAGTLKNAPTAAGNAAAGYHFTAANNSSQSAATVIAHAGKAVVSPHQVTAAISSGGTSTPQNPAKSALGQSSVSAQRSGQGLSAAASGASSSPVSRAMVDPQHQGSPGTPVAASATASPIARPNAPGAEGALEMRATAAAPLVTAPQPGANGQGLVQAVTTPQGGSVTAEQVEAVLVRNGGRAMAPLKKRTWFSQFSHLGKTQSGRDITFFQISGGKSAVYSLASRDAGILLIAEKGDFFPLIEENAAWCKVALKDTAGWIERNKGIVVSTPSTGISEQLSFIVIVLSSLAVVAVLLLLLRYRARARKRVSEKKIRDGSALEGDIAESNLPEILQFIEIGKKTGCLQIEDKSPLGIIYFADGRIVHAAAVDNIGGRDAVNYILGLQAGSFRFLLDKQPKVRDVDLSTLEVLMEWTKTEDEAHRN